METDLLAELVNRRHDVLTRLRDLSRRQIELAASGDTTALLGALATKQTLIEELQATDRQLDPFRAQDPECRRWRSLADRRRCQQAAEACHALLSEIMLLEKHSETDMLRRRDETAARLQGAHTGDRARQAYARTAPVGRGQFDITSDR